MAESDCVKPVLTRVYGDERDAPQRQENVKAGRIGVRKMHFAEGDEYDGCFRQKGPTVLLTLRREGMHHDGA